MFQCSQCSRKKNWTSGLNPIYSLCIKTFANNDACPHFFVHSFVFKSKNGNIGTSAAKSLILKGKQRSSDLEHDWNTPGTCCISWNSRHYV